MLEDFCTWLKDQGVQVPDNAVDRFYAEQFGPPRTEWTREERSDLRKAVQKELQNYRERAHVLPSPDEIVDHLWKIGWEFNKSRWKNQVIGMDKAVQVYMDTFYPKEDAPMTDAELADPYLIDCLAMLKKYYIYPDEREQRMLVRAKVHLTWLEMAIQILRADNAHRSKYEIKNLIPHGQDLYEHRNAKRRL